jgi:hypothetical protein
MAGVMPAAAGDLATDAAECKRLGFVQGTSSFLQCLQLAARDHERAQAQADAQAQWEREQAQTEADRRAKCLAVLSNPGPGVQAGGMLGPVGGLGPAMGGAYQQGYVAGSIQRWCR